MGRSQYPLEIHGLQTILDDGINTEDLEVKDLLLFILAELRVTNRHLALMTDEEINVDDELEV